MEIQPGERWQIGIGARQQFFAFINQSAFDPQIRANYQYNDKLHFKASAGIYHQYLQSFQETDFTISNATEQLWILAGSTEGRGIIENRQLTLGFLYSNKGWLIDVDGFRKQLTGLNARKINPILDPFYMAEETIYGMDLLIKKRFKRLRLWATYSFQNSNAQVEELNLMNIPAFSNLTHQLKVVQSYELGSFSFSTSYTYRSGAPYAFADGIKQVREGDIIFYEVDYANINEKRLPNYNRFDASLWYYFPKDQQAKITGSLGLSVINVFNNNNIANRNYAVDDDAEGRIILTQTDRNLYGFTPNISLRLKIL